MMVIYNPKNDERYKNIIISFSKFKDVKAKIDLSKSYDKYQIPRKGNKIGNVGFFVDDKGEIVVNLLRVNDEVMIISKIWNNELIKLAIDNNSMIRLYDDNNKMTMTFDSKRRNLFVKMYLRGYEKIIRKVIK